MFHQTLSSLNCCENNLNENNKDAKVEQSKRLALKLKDHCNNKGIEIDPVTSSKIIHKLGLLYFQKNCNKISLIQSVGLLNSAIARNPQNILVIKRDLSKVCQFILDQAKAQNLTADLIEKANEVKNDIDSMRKEVNQRLAFLKTIENYEKLNNTNPIAQQKAKIKSIKEIQLHITKRYKKIMTDLSQYCQHVMGPPPCKFAVVGMGSLARNEITPYSDFEHIILLENLENKNCCDENCEEYFRWFSVIFHVIVLNLQETIIPSLNIEYLNDKTSELGDWFFDTCTRGISFDGMMVHACKFPLGRTQPTKNKPWTNELIKPVNKMLKYLSDDEHLKNGYYLSDILTVTCFVYGDQALHDAFETGIKLHKTSKTHDELLEEIKKQVTDDLNSFATRTKLVSLKPNGTLNVKQMFYRTSTLFITALGKICETESSSCFDIISELAEQQKISENTKHKLSHAVAIACEIRLCVYMKMQTQCDYIQPIENSQTIFDEILGFISAQSIVSYFQITYCLQREIIKMLAIRKSYIYSNFTLMNITICYALRLDKPMVALLTEKLKFLNESNSDSEQENVVVTNKFITNFDNYLSDMENEIKSCASKLASEPHNILSIILAFINAASDDDFINFEENIELKLRVIEIFQRSSLSDNDLKNTVELGYGDIFSLIGINRLYISAYLIALNKFDEASTQINRTFESFDTTKSEPRYIFELYYVAGINCLAMKKYEKSLTWLQIALGICLSIDLFHFEYDFAYDCEIAMTYAGIGISLLKQTEYKESLIHLNVAVEMIEDVGLERFESCGFMFLNPTSTYHHLGKCLMELGQYEKALSCFFEALEITENKNTDKENDLILTQLSRKTFLEKQKQENRASIFHDLGLLYKNINNFKDSAIYLHKSFKIWNKLSHKKLVDEARVELLKCYMEIYLRKKFD